MTKIVMIVEDNQDMQMLYKHLFQKENEIEIVQVEKGEDALERIPSVNPDLLIVDISLPGLSGLELTKIVRERLPDVKILVVTGHEITRYYDEAIKCGANDLISKDYGKDIVSRCKEYLGLK